MEPIVIIMAAGMGSRYGGLKQIDPVGPDGEIIIDYSIYDAVKAGFKKFIFVIKQENHAAFQEILASKLPKDLDVQFAFQDVADIPETFTVPEGRVKPWGTAHAIYAARNQVDAPFMVINADDYYGPEAFQLMYDFLKANEAEVGKYSMVAYKLANTLTENGSVSRGVCTVEGDQLETVTERKEIYADGPFGKFTEDGGESFESLGEDTLVSMNFWGFQTDFMDAVRRDLTLFFEEEVDKNPLKAEFYLPSVVSNQIKGHGATVTVLPTDDVWMGVTYQEDREEVKKGFEKFVEDGRYPSPLW